MVYSQEFSEPTNGHVILVHGLGEHFRRHHRLIDRLEDDGFKVHAFDWPGHGNSPGKRGHARIKEAIEIIDDFADNIDEKPFLFGHSLGGLTVLRYAEEHPDKIKSVISSSPVLKKSEDLSSFTVKLVSFLSHIFPKKTISNSLDVEEITRSKKERKKYRKDDLVHDRISLALSKDIFKNIDIAHEKKERIDSPLLLLVGTEDKICPKEGAERFIDDLDLEKDKKIKKFEGSHHEIFNDPEHKEKFHETILRWVRDHS